MSKFSLHLVSDLNEQILVGFLHICTIFPDFVVRFCQVSLDLARIC